LETKTHKKLILLQGWYDIMIDKEQKLYKPNNKTKKALLMVNLTFFAFSIFSMVLFIQYPYLAPFWMACSMIVLFIISFAYFIYGFWFRLQSQLESTRVVFLASGMLLVSIQIFLSCNLDYLIDTYHGIILKPLNFLGFSTTIYLVTASVVSLIAYLLLTRKVLQNKEKLSTKTSYLASIIGILSVLFIVLLLKIIGYKYLLEDYKAVKDNYNFFIGSVLFGFISISLYIIILKSKISQRIKE
jgi:hypothetical protein